jgi:hypothetical protein
MVLNNYKYSKKEKISPKIVPPNYLKILISFSNKLLSASQLNGQDNSNRTLKPINTLNALVYMLLNSLGGISR